MRLCVCVGWRDAGERAVKSQLLIRREDWCNCTDLGFGVRNRCFKNYSKKLHLFNQTLFCLVFSVMFKHILSFRTKPIKETYLAV